MRFLSPRRSMNCVWAVLALMTLPVGARAAEERAYLDVEKAGVDFQLQGEYAAQEGSPAYGLQVMALGDGKFDGVLYTGGLPGAGWDGKTKVNLAGIQKGGALELTGTEATGVIAEGTFQGTAGNITLVLKKTVRKSPTLEAKPPEGAIVLFDGKNTDAWENGKLDGDLLGVGTRTKQKFSSYKLHLEFRTPFMPKARGQGRGNSGMYLNDQYECQILDSFGLSGENNECGGFYTLAKPLVNMALPPLSWQTYDVDFQAAKYDAAGKKVKNAVVTMKHNGVVIHDQLELPKNTPGGGINDEKLPGAIYLQDHGDPVRFRNIWIVETK